MKLNEAFSNAKIGDKVWSTRYGWGVITKIKDESDHPIITTFCDSNRTLTQLSFMENGKFSVYDVYPTLFWKEVRIPEDTLKQPFHDLEVDTVIEVWNNIPSFYPNNEYDHVLRHFAGWSKDGKPMTWINGKTSFTVQNNDCHTETWDNYKLYEKK